MAQQVQRTETSTMIKATKVADYIVERIAAEGISHCFGVAGDYVFPICDAVDSSPKVKWIGCANELNASYAADCYARIRGAAMLATTYGVGELSALNGVMGAKAERSLVFHVVGMPSYQHQRVGKIAHHTLGDGVFGNFVDLSGSAACCHAIITPENCVLELERVIAEAKRNNQPAYIAVPSDHALSPVVPVEVKPTPLRSNEAALQKAHQQSRKGCRISRLHDLSAWPAERSAEGDRSDRVSFCHDADGKMRDRRGPFAVCRHVCRRRIRSESPANCSEGADLVLDLGGVNLNDITTAAYSAQLDRSQFITVGLNDVRIEDKSSPGCGWRTCSQRWPSSNHHRRGTKQNHKA
jgi:indolepyruvate decarboxylase